MEEIIARPKAETGPMEFPGNFPGVYIRSDHAMLYHLAIDALLPQLNKLVEERKGVATVDIVQLAILRGLGDLLVSVSKWKSPTTQKVCFQPEPED